MKFFYYAISYYVNRIKILFAPNSKKKLIFLLCCISLFARAEWQSTDSSTLNTIRGEVQSINTSTLESENKLQEIQTHLNSIKNWKSIVDSIDTSTKSIMGHTTYFYNVLSSLASAYPTISQSSWFGQVLQEQKNFNSKLQTLIDNPTDLSTVESELQSSNYKLGQIEEYTSFVPYLKSFQEDIYNLCQDYLPYISVIDYDILDISDNIYNIKDKISTIHDTNENIFHQLQIGDTNLYNALFNPRSYDTYYYWQDLNFQGNDIDATISRNNITVGGYLTPNPNWSFIQAFFSQQRAKSQQDVQLSKLQNVANLNLQEIRKKGIHDITNLISSQTYTLDQSISNNINRIIKVLHGTGSGEESDSSLTDIQAKLLTQIIQNENLRDHLYESQMNFSGEFKKDLLRLLRYQTTLDVSQNYAQLSILTNLQCLVVNTIGEQERLQNEFDEGIQAIDKEGKQGLAMFEDNSQLSEFFSINNTIAKDYISNKDIDFSSFKVDELPEQWGFSIPAIRIDPNADTPLDFEVSTFLSNNNSIFEWFRIAFTLFNWSIGLYISYLIIGYSLRLTVSCFNLLHGAPVQYSFVSKGYM